MLGVEFAPRYTILWWALYKTAFQPLHKCIPGSVCAYAGLCKVLWLHWILNVSYNQRLSSHQMLSTTSKMCKASLKDTRRSGVVTLSATSIHHLPLAQSLCGLLNPQSRFLLSKLLFQKIGLLRIHSHCHLLKQVVGCRRRNTSNPDISSDSTRDVGLSNSNSLYKFLTWFHYLYDRGVHVTPQKSEDS